MKKMSRTIIAASAATVIAMSMAVAPAAAEKKDVIVKNRGICISQVVAGEKFIPQELRNQCRN